MDGGAMSEVRPLSVFRRRAGRLLSTLAVAQLVALSHPATVLAQAKPAVAAPGGKKAADLLARGASLFEDQQYEESIQALSAALLRPDLTTEQRVDIYRLLALDYITIGHAEEAESAVRGLLAQKPDYALPTSESPRFRDFFDAAKKRWIDDGRPGLVTAAAPPPKPVLVKSQASSEVAVGETLTITGRVEDPENRLAKLTLHYRSGTKTFVALPVTLTGGTFRTQVPGAAVKAPLIDYYLEGQGKDGLPIATRGDAVDPLRTVVREPTKGWVVPVAIAGGVVGAAAVVGGLALAGVFKSNSNSGPGTAVINVNVAPAFR